MKPKDIEVGKLYNNPNAPGIDYLGCQSTNPNGQKHLVIITECVTDNCGRFVVPYKSNPSFWSDFYLKSLNLE